MKGMLAPLSPHEETALRKIAAGTGNPIDADHVRRLLQLEPIEGEDGSWSLTAAGRQRYDELVSHDLGGARVV